MSSFSIPADLGSEYLASVQPLNTIERTAELLDCSRDTVRRMIARGELRAVRVGPRMLRVPAEAIHAALRPLATAGSTR